MKRNEWIRVLSKAQDLAKDDETCFNMFGYLLDAMKEVPTLHYRCGEDTTEEETEEEE